MATYQRPAVTVTAFEWDGSNSTELRQLIQASTNAKLRPTITIVDADGNPSQPAPGSYLVLDGTTLSAVPKADFEAAFREVRP